MSKSGFSKISYWDGKTKSFRVYVSKIEAYVKFVGMGDALDPVLMKNCPTWSEFVVLDVMRPNDQQLVKFYLANKNLCAIIMLGQGKSHGIALLGKTKMMIILMDWHGSLCKRPKRPTSHWMQVP